MSQHKLSLEVRKARGLVGIGQAVKTLDPQAQRARRIAEKRATKGTGLRLIALTAFNFTGIRPKMRGKAKG